jgi:amino acid adenylation domain-containing protein
MFLINDDRSISSLQLGMLYAGYQSPETGLYLQQIIADLDEIELDLFIQVWKTRGQSYDILQTAFLWEDGDEPIRVIDPQAELPVKIMDWSGDTHEQQQEKFDTFLHSDRRSGFDLGKAPLSRIAIIKTGKTSFRFVWTFHQILMDEFTRDQLLSDVFRTYDDLCKNTGSQTVDFQPVHAVFHALNHFDQKNAEIFWRGELGDFEARTPLLHDPYPKKHQPGEPYHYEQLWLGNEESERLRGLEVEKNIQLSTLLQSAWSVLLSCYSGNDDVLFGVSIGRKVLLDEGKEDPGFANNIVPLRVMVPHAKTLLPWMTELQEKWAGMRPYYTTPLPLAKQWSGVNVNEPLFDSVLILEDHPKDFDLYIDNEAKAFHFSALDLWDVPLTVGLVVGEDMLLQIRYDGSQVSSQIARRILGHLKTILHEFSLDPSRIIDTYSMLDEDDKQQILVDWNNTDQDYESDFLLHHIFAEKVKLHPEKIALISEGKHLTYREVDIRSNRLAHYLQTLGVKPDTLVGLCLERTENIYICWLAVLKAGGAFVSLDPNSPADRLAFMAEDAQFPITITTRSLQSLVSNWDSKIIYLDDLEGQFPKEYDLPVESDVTPDNLAYVIYTSGSTGKPKGAMLHHRGVANYTLNFANHLPVGETCNILQFSTVHFDASIAETFVAIGHGGTLTVATHEEQHSIPDLVSMLNREDVNTLLITPSLLRMLPESQLKKVKFIISVGEACSQDLVNTWEQGRSFYNGYGPTETSVMTSLERLRYVEVREILPIGRPLPNCRYYILNSMFQPVPVGAPGELFIAGICVGRGYLNRPELTAERFLESPFMPHEKMYRSGDLVRYLPDGNVEYLGRIDYQVKIRGFRIELGEIEAVLRTHAGIEQAVVMAQTKDDGDKYLEAYILPVKDSPAPGKEELQDFLSKTLPDYMVPSVFVTVDHIPLNQSGKIDRRALNRLATERPIEQKVREYIAPQTEIEVIIVDEWKAIFGKEQIGLTDNFFDLGGHSLLVMRLMAYLRGKFQIELPFRTVFEAPTVKELAERVEQIHKGPEEKEQIVLRVAEKAESYPLSYAQESLWLVNQLEPGNNIYNETKAYRLKGKLNKEALEQAVNALVMRHDALRTRFMVVDGQVSQVVEKEMKIKLEEFDLSGYLEEEEREDAVQKLALEEKLRIFDLEKGPLFRSKLFRLGEDENILVLTIHHIVTDGWSMGIIDRELGKFYSAALRSEPVDLPALPYQYVDYTMWQRKWMQGEKQAQQMAYWKKKLAGLVTLDLPTDHPKSAKQTNNGAILYFDVPAEIANRFKELCKREGVTFYMGLLAAFSVLMHRYSRADDITVGTGLANRRQDEIEGLIGYFVNMLVMRNDLGGNPRFVDLLKKVKENTLEAYAHQDLPFTRLVEELQPERESNRNPLFQVLFELQSTQKYPLEMEGLESSEWFVDTTTAKFDLSFFMEEFGENLQGSFEYSTDLFERETIELMTKHLLIILRGILENVEERIDQLPMLTAEEREQLVTKWNRTEADYPRESSVQKEFEKCVEDYPENVAVVCGDEQVNYRELNKRANRLARYLLDLGIKEGDFVGIYTERSVDMIAGLLAILKAGGVYVPLEASYPKERLSYILDDSQARVVLTQQKMAHNLPGRSIYQIIMDRDAQRIDGYEATNLNLCSKPDDLAYVMYTSGSTGMPKGVCVPHRGIIRLVKNQNFIEYGPDDVFIQFSNLAFDLSTFEIWGSLLNGGKLVVIPGLQATLAQLGNEIQKQKVTTLWLTAGLFHQMVEENLEDLRGLKYLVAGGDVLSPKHVRTVLEKIPDCTMINGYGPTENTTFTTCYVMQGLEDDWASVPIGKPLANTTVYILDEYMQPVPVGVMGELYTGGDGLAQGYWRRPELTAERFVPDPFSKKSGARLYRTGDYARYLRDGRIEFLGRMDFQVKIRGFRVELGEIETALEAYESVEQAVVIAREKENNDKQIEAYLLPAKGKAPLDKAGLREYLKSTLPDYMIPAVIVEVEQMPLTASGKMDRRALSKLGESMPREEKLYVAPRDMSETIIAEEWKSIFGLTRVGADDNFFELGGHSLLVMKLIARLKKRFGVEVPFKTVFETPTVSALAKRVEQIIKETEEKDQVVLQVAPKADYYPLSYAQESLWLVNRLDPDSSEYNELRAYRLEGKLNKGALEQALNALLMRHEALRTRFLMIGGQAVQAVVKDMKIVLDEIDLSGSEEEEKENVAREIAAAERLRKFDLEKGPLLRGLLFKLGEDRHILVLLMHHIAIDGWSMGVLDRDLGKLYNAALREEPADLPALPFQYVDYTMWQREWMKGDKHALQMAYWKEKLADLTTLDLPTDYPRSAKQTNNGAIVFFDVPPEITKGILELCKREEATLFMGLLAAFDVLLHRYSSAVDITVGTAVASRKQEEIEGLIGYFMNMLVMRNDLGGNPKFVDLLRQVKENTLEAYAHQDLPFTKLVEELQPARESNRNPLFQVVFELLSAQKYPLEMEGLRTKEWIVSEETAKFDLSFFIEEKNGRLEGGFEYSTDLYDRATIERMAGHLKEILKAVVKDPEERIDLLPMLTAKEREQIVVEWNQTESDYPRNSCVHKEFELQAAARPAAVALAKGEECVSYQQLNERANRLARYLVKFGVRDGSFVAICLERSINLYVSILAILKAGGVYLPLDISHPQERLNFMLEDSAARIVLTQKSLASKFSANGLQLILLDRENEQIDGYDSSNLDILSKPDSTAYVMYTSGSTGVPKGVCVPHRGIIRLVKNQNYMQFSPEDVTIQFANVAFDASTLEIWGCLLNGGKLVIIPQQQPTLSELGKIIREQKVTSLALTAGLFHVLVETNLEDLRGLKYFMVGGDVFSPRAARTVLENLGDCTLINAYGPTENTTNTTCHVMKGYQRERWSSVPIGRPVSNTTVYILDDYMQPVPVGVMGELYTGGDGVALGYLNRPELTAERFVPDPFSSKDGARLYRTGDYARYLPDGKIEFLGRMDKQIKIRGFRVELGEIEAKLENHPAVKQVVIESVDLKNGDKRIHAYIVLKPDSSVTGAELESFLKVNLPDYMIPNSFVFLDAFPLTPNGKVDRNALAKIQKAEVEKKREYIQATNPLEDKLVQMWCEVLGLERVGINNNFFELGGNSLLAARLFSSIETVFGKQLPITMLFKNPTVAQFADALSREQLSISNRSLIAIKEGGDKLPLYCVHTLGGMVGTYYLLAKYLDDDQPVYGVFSQWENEKEKIYSSIEDTASYCAEQIMAFQPEGPYLIGGYSFGGMVAFETARQIQLRGGEVGLLALFDTLPTIQSLPFPGRIPYEISFGIRYIGFHLRKMLENPVNKIGDYLLPRMKKAVKKVKDKMKKWNIDQPAVDKIERTEAVIQTNMKALERYKYPQAPLKVTLFKAQQEYTDTFHKFPYGWQFFAMKGVEVCHCRGNHYTFFKMPHVQELSRQLQPYLDRVSEKTGEHNQDYQNVE